MGLSTRLHMAVALPLVLLSVADADSVGVLCPKGFSCESAAGGCADEHRGDKPINKMSTNCSIGRYELPRDGVTILTYRVLNTTWDMDANITWLPPLLPGPQCPLPALYYVDINFETFFKTNATSIVITGLNKSINYQVSIEAYAPVVETVCSSATLYKSFACCSFTSAPLTACCSSTSAPLTPCCSSTSALLTPCCSSTSAPLTPCCSSSSVPSGVAQSTILGAGIASSVALLILIVLVLAMVLWCVARKKRTAPISNLQLITSNVDEIPESGPVCNEVSSAKPKPPSCFVVYSHNTPSEEKEVILQNLIKGLSDYGIEATSHDWVGRAMLPFWVETVISNAAVVLCVCNKAFHQEWLCSETSDQAVVHSVKQLLGAELCRSKDLAKKYAVVLMKRSHKQFIPSHYLEACRQFYVTDVTNIAHFIKNVPLYSVDL